jgi:hypothetical protein
MSLWGARVVTVDLDAGMQHRVTRVLTGSGAEVIADEGLGRALATVVGVVPDVLLVDVDGQEDEARAMLRLVRTLPPEKGGRVPAVAISRCPLGDGGVAGWHGAGFQIHLHAPFDGVEICTVVGYLAGRAVERRQRALDRRLWPAGVSRDRRCPLPVAPSGRKPHAFVSA